MTKLTSTHNMFFGDMAACTVSLEDVQVKTLQKEGESFCTLPLETSRFLGTSSNGVKQRLGIVGTGNFAISLTKCLVMAGYDVMIGSRRPDLRRKTLPLPAECKDSVELTSIAECLAKSVVIFIAIHVDVFQDTLGKYEEATTGKVLVDVSNREQRGALRSNAERLASILPGAVVVKAFNTLSAQVLDQVSSRGGEGPKVFIASDSRQGRLVVSDIAKSLGLNVVELGGLKFASCVEERVLETFPGWKVPLLLASVIFSLCMLLGCYRTYVEGSYLSWQNVFLRVLNRPLCMAAMTMLALTYLPGQLAAILQLYHGTKHKRFPTLLDSWLRCRKQMGLTSFALTCGHALVSTLINSPTYYGWFSRPSVTLPDNITAASGVTLRVSDSWMNWQGESSLLVGIIAFLLMSVVAVTSLPSVGGALNWAEWKCVQSRLGFFVLFLSLAHVCVIGAPYWVKVLATVGVSKLFKSYTFLSAILPVVVLFLKVFFSCPPLCWHLRRIRRGWERGVDKDTGRIEQGC